MFHNFTDFVANVFKPRIETSNLFTNSFLFSSICIILAPQCDLLTKQLTSGVLFSISQVFVLRKLVVTNLLMFGISMSTLLFFSLNFACLYCTGLCKLN